MEKANLIDLIRDYWKPIVGFIGLVSWGAKLEIKQRVHKDQIGELMESTSNNTKDIVDLKVDAFTKKDAQPLFKEMNKNGKSLARIEGFLQNNRRR